jgi:tetratricopeptide (TPR) repeat protein
MKILYITAAVCFLILPGCRKADEKKVRTIPFAVQHAPRVEPVQLPDYEGLILEYRSVLAEDPNNTAAIIGLANAYSASGAWQEAIEQYERALKHHGRSADLHTDIGKVYRNLGMPGRALAEYRKALEYEPGNMDARYNMGIVYAFDLRKYGVAIHVWEELLRLAPNHPKADYMENCIVAFRKTIKKETP